MNLKYGKLLAIGMVALAIFAWARLPWTITRHADFPYPELPASLQASLPELQTNPDPYAEKAWGRMAAYRLPQGTLTLTYRPTGDWVAIRTIFRKLSDNTPTDWETITIPEGSVAWRLENGHLELATLVHAGGRLTVTDAEYGQAIHRESFNLTNFVLWFTGQSKLRDRRAVLVHFTLAKGDVRQVQTFVPTVVQAAKLTAESF